VIRVASFIILIAISSASNGQEVVYISDQQFIPLRSGPGSEYRILHRGIPSGTEEVPPRMLLAAAQEKNQGLEKQLGSVNELLQELRDNYRIVSGELSGKEEQLALTGSELAEIRRISSNALTLDGENRRLVEESEVLKSRIEVLEADNQRLLDSGENEAFINGALAVGLGVMITLLVPRLWPKRRRSTSWA
jgi:SH3 domain protein